MNFSKGTISSFQTQQVVNYFHPFSSTRLSIYGEHCAKAVHPELGLEGANQVTIFGEWFLRVVVPWARRKEVAKVLIVDKLSSHFSGLLLDKS
ncbi:hypothetical protein PoB_006747200 [Plakobranchus ocellatus]|uniref:DDE-1 domain-containing protein n=1 Tax=Plakobranchus ocellatus TaxID=259542 RepID=A0AAV4D9P2_9GAST|nr:hypothetical protein PoB_006747200 [Plakobranchus ocellatus]